MRLSLVMKTSSAVSSIRSSSLPFLMAFQPSARTVEISDVRGPRGKRGLRGWRRHRQACRGSSKGLRLCSNLPVGMFGGRQFESGTAQCALDDLFPLFTDGVLEAANAADEEFGLPALQTVMAANSGNPLSADLQAILNATDRHGRSTDDRSPLFVRALGYREMGGLV